MGDGRPETEDFLKLAVSGRFSPSTRSRRVHLGWAEKITRKTHRQPNIANWLWTFDDRAALLAPIGSSAFCCRFQFLEFIVSLAGSLETFRTIAIPKFLAGHGQMAMAAAQRSPSYGQQFESHVLAGSHDSKCRFLMNVGGIGEPSKSDHSIFVFARTTPLRLLRTHLRRV